MRTLVALAGLTAFLLGCQAPRPQFTEQDATAIRALFDGAERNIRAGDFAAWAAHFSDSALFLPPNAPAVVGRAAIQAWGQAMPAVEQFGFWDIRIAGEGNLAYGTSAYMIKLAGLPADTGKQLVVWGRQPDGMWHVLRGGFSSNLPPPQLPRATPARRR